MSKVNTGQASSTLIPKYIGSDFDKVVAVADNIEQVVIVGDNIEDVGTVADNINYVKEVAEDLHGMPVTMYTGENPPVLTPMPEGVMWYCTTDGRTYVWYTDADSGQWVESAPQSAMKDETTNIFFHATPSNVNPAYRNATLFSTSSPEAEISVAHNALNTPVVQAQFIREEALWVDVSVTGAQGIVTLMGYSSGNSQLKAEIITWKNGAEGTSLGASQWVTLPNQPSVVSLPVTLANIDVLDAGDSYVVRLTSQMNAGGSAVSTILVDGNTSSRFGIIFNTNLIGLNDGIRDGVITSAPTENAVYDALQLKAAKTEVSDALQLKVGKSQLVQSGELIPVADWADVPAYSDSELGGSGGPLNAQAKALTARSELLLTDVREALRRSYAEAGYNVVGTFQAGFTLVNANDVGIDLATGKGYAGPSGTVAAGTNPTSGGFVDRSGAVYGTANLADISAGLYGLGARLRVKDLGNSLWAIVMGGVVDGVTVRDAGGGKTAVLQYEAWMDLESFGVSEAATPAQNFAGLAAAIKSNTPFTSKNKTYTIGTGSIDASVKTINWVAYGTEIKLDSGNKPSALFVLRDGWSYYLSGMTWNGNRLNVSGNNAGFFVVSRTANFIAENTKFKDLRRYGYNITGDNPYNTNVKIINLQCDNIGVLSAANGGPVGEAGALGEAVKCEHVRNFTLDGFDVKNSSGTGDGQVQKAFYCVNVTLKNFNLESVGPSYIYPAISNVRNRNVSYENINIIGASQVCIEDNSNLSVTYKNILTFGRKAMISGSDGAELGARHSQNITIENWDDTSTEPLAFNIIAAQGLTVRGLSTNQNINISRDDPSTDRRSRDISLSDVTCTNLSTLLTQGYLELNDCDILGVWTNTHVGTAVDNNSAIASYTDSAQADTALVRITPSTNAINVFSALDPGSSVTFKMPKGVATNPFAGKISAINAFTSSPATQWSQIDWAFYDPGTPTVNKQVVMSGSTPRQNTTLVVSAANKTLTFTNNDSVQVLLVARVELIDRNAYKG